MKEWYFPYGKDIEKESVNNARIETFRDNALESLARETCQNSLDARRNKDSPVLMTFNEKVISSSDIPDIDSFLYEIIPKARKTWVNDKNAQDFLDKYEKILKKNSIRVLKISDYNTTGLEGGRWESLIEQAGTSMKDDISSAGSFGIGKAAPFANSDLRMVFYSTRLPDETEKSIGVTKFISYDRNDGMTAQGVGYLGEFEKQPIMEQESFNFIERHEIGTDIYILAFNQRNSWKETIVNSLLENFLISIFHEDLIIKVEDTLISKETMHDLISSLKMKKYDTLKNYYYTLIDDEALKFKLDDRFLKYGFKPEDGKLILSRGINSIRANRSVLMTRKAGMKIYDRKNISGSIQFNGIFQAYGEELNEMLKKMENPSHNDWIADRYEEDPMKAQKLLDDIYHFIKDNVLKNYQENIEKQVDAFGISDFLPNKPDSDKRPNDSEGMDIKIKDIVIKERKVRSSVNSSEYEIGENIVYELFGEDNQYPNSSDERDKEPGEGENSGNNESIPSNQDNSRETGVKFKESKEFKAKVIEKRYLAGEYRVLINSSKSVKLTKLEIKLVGESGSSYDENILKAFNGNDSLKISKNAIFIENISKGITAIDFFINSSERAKMGVKIYENK